MTLRFIALLLCVFASFFATDTSYPYISGNTFKAHCDFSYDEISRSFDPQQVKHGNTIFIKTDCLQVFFSKVHPKIKSKYIIITHNSDYSVPGIFADYLDDEKILAWYGINVENCDHRKLQQIPIGIANKCWPHGNVKTIKKKQLESFPRDILLYMNFSAGTYRTERDYVANLFANKSFCVSSSSKRFDLYLEDLARSYFVLSPRGNGLDCHRTWEALLMGAYPIVRSSSLDPLYEGLPVVIVQSWEEVTEDFLHKKYEEMRLMKFQTERMYIDYWLSLIMGNDASIY